MKDYYQILGIANDAENIQIKRSFRKLAQKYHPDKYNGTSEKFLDIYEAYRILSNSLTRKEYDKILHQHLKVESDKIYKIYSRKYDHFFKEVEEEKNVFGKLTFEELEVYINIIFDKIPDLALSLILVVIGGGISIISFSSSENISGIVLSIAIGLPLFLVGMRDISLVFKAKRISKYRASIIKKT